MRRVFRFNLLQAIKKLVSICESHEIPKLRHLAQKDAKDFKKEDKSEIIRLLLEYIVVPEYTIKIGRIFRKIIPILLIELPNHYLYQSHTASTLEKLPIISSAISKLLTLSPHCLNIVLEFYQNQTSLLDCLQSSPQHTLEIVKTCYRFLKVSSAEFSLLWNWSKLFELLQNTNSEIQYFALKCISLYIGMSDTAKQELVSQKFNVNPITASIHEYEDEAIEQAALFLGNSEEEITDNDDVCFTHHDLPSSLVDVCGILFKRKQTNTDYYNLRATELTYTETTEQNMLALALAVSQGHPILLEGITGAGKTALIDHLASETGNTDLIKVHLGDQADAKVLLGTYICTDVPGEFKWQPGALTQAVKEGRWIVIEDIDLAPMDVLSILIPLLETRQLFIPGRGEQIPAKNGFQMFATQTIGHLKTSATLLSNLWTRVFIEPLSLEELSVLLQKKYPELSSVVHKFLQTYKLLIRNKKSESEPTNELEGIIATNRYISLRDLMKWCNRVDRLYKLSTSSNASIKEYIFCAAVDCFSGMISKVHLRSKFIQLIGMSWDLSPDRLHFYQSLNKPTINVAPTTASVGRVTLVRDSKIVHSPKSNFAYTMLSMQMLEKISVCVQLSEPVLLVGETGTGKTTVVQYLADLLGQKLVVMNLSQQSESSDLVGGFRPVEMVSLCIPLKERFDQLFGKTFSKKKNADFCTQLEQTFVSKDWPNFLLALRTIFKRVEKMMKLPSKDSDSKERTLSPELREKWKQFAALLYKFESQLDKSKNNFAFSFVEGPLIKAVREGHWVLLDEMNLASAETLESLSGLLEGGSLSISERGDIEPIPRHPNFRVFACMNPPNDVGKKDLAPGLRNRFTEFFVDELDSKDDLKTVVLSYLKDIGSYSGVADDIVAFYLEARDLAQNKLTDGANHKPHYSLRTLCRALEYIRLVVNDYGFPRGLFEGFSMSFLTQLNVQSTLMMEALLKKHLMKKINEKALLQAPPKPPAQNYEKFEHFWIELGNQPVSPMDQYILTDSIKKNLNTLARIVIAKKYPILLQGPTSSGKTSMVEYLAKKTGHRFVRINNHEHTDLQEYLGTYISDSQGKLVFQEGILVEAVRKGYWIVLDELNLAPSEVLEALNRLLDDNRELFIPETGEVIKANAQFQLFATQNPPGLYGGRKVLSRAFRNRFIEIHVDDIPETELEIILEQRSKIPRSFAQKLVAIMKDLQRNRQSTQVFAGKHGFITLRDLFRWAERKPGSYEELAVTGYMLLAERLRKEEEKLIIKQAIEKNLKVNLDIQAIYNQCEKTEDYAKLMQQMTSEFKIVWTNSMKRLFTLVGECMKHDEPVLLVGETGNGKTTVCQLYSMLLAQKLHILNCHQHTETSDFLGGLRPVRSKHKIKSELVDRVNACSKWVKTIHVDVDQDVEEIYKIVLEIPEKVNHKIKRDSNFVSEMKEIHELYRHFKSLFIWYDGPLVQAMKNGDLFLIDEISLADDAVLERLNSVLEPHRLLVLAEKGSTEIEELYANKKFRILATMNPGGDFGKKELSPAMRNRFTEIWVPSTTNETEELAQIIESRFKSQELEGFSKYIIEFFLWFSEKQKSKQVLSVRDVLAWCDFMNVAVHQLKLSNFESLIHGAHLILLDGLGIGSSTTSANAIKSLRGEAFLKLLDLIPENERKQIMEKESIQSTQFVDESNNFGTSLFKVAKGDHKVPFPYSLQAPTTSVNALRVLRALQLRKPVLLEGSPGVGKTSLISALASATGHRLVRINLSEHTDLMDLLGTDLPVEGGKPGEFQWCDGVFLRALKAGDWVLLDELNLAPQSVLEGLNSCLDHRTTIYIPELNHTFECPKEFRIFACQNPLHQGGGRKGLPKSFLNRFTKVFLDSLDSSDLLFIATSMYPRISPEILENMIRFNSQVFEDTMVQCKYGRKGSPWEFNLRDIFRWCDLIAAHPGSQPSDFVDLVYLQRMRTLPDRKALLETYNQIMGHMPKIDTKPYYHITPTTVQVGNSTLSRSQSGYIATPRKLELLHQFLNPIENIMKCIEMNWMCIITGSTASGKTSMVRLLSQLTRNTLYEFAMNTSVDTTELLGGFEQVDFTRYRKQIVAAIDQLLEKFTETALVQKDGMQVVTEVHNLWSMFKIRSRFPKIDPTSHLLFDKEEYQLVEKILQILASGTHDYVSTAQSLLSKLIKFESLSQQSIIGSFEWVDGMLIQALEQGHWILIDNVNFCNPTVLDRLNPLLEPNGVLMVNERGLINGEIKVIKPHPNFRIFLTMDTKHGEISRAMRNRGIEISLVDFDVNSIDTVTLIANIGIPVPLAKKMVEYHRLVVDSFGSTVDNPITLRNILDWAKLLTEQVLRGISLSTAILHGAEQTYIKNRSKVQDYQTLRDLYASVFTSFDISHDTLLSPNYWPVNISASGYVTDSVETTIMRQGSLFQHFVRKSMLHEMERAVVTTNDVKSYVDKLPKSAHLSLPSTLLQHLLLDATKPFNLKIDLKKEAITETNIIVAGKYLIENMSLQDHNVRIQFMEFQLENHSNLKPMFSYVVRHLLAHPIMKEVEQIFSAVQNHSLLGYQPFNLNAPFLHRLFSSQEKLLSLKPRYLSLVQKLEFLIARLFQEYSELQTYNTPKKSEMSLLHESYLHYNNKLGKTKPSNAFLVPLVYPLFKSIDDLLNNLLQSPQTYVSFPELEEFVQLRDSYWKLLNQIPYQLGEVVVYWHFIYKYIQKHLLKQIPEDKMLSLKNILGKFVEWAETHGYLLRMSPLWKSAHPSNLFDNQLFLLDCKFKEISKNIQINSLLQTETKNQWSEYVDEEFKRTLIDGLCTIRYLVTINHKSEQFQRLFDHIKEIPTLLEHRRVQLEADYAKRKTNVFASLPKVIDKDHSDDSTLRLVYLKHNPQSVQMLQDHSSLLSESEILGQLSKLSVPPYIDIKTGKFTATGLETVRDMQVTIRQFIAKCLQDTGRSVLHLVPYQTLLWYLTSYTPAGAASELRSVTLNDLLQEMYYNFNSQVWHSLGNETIALNFNKRDQLVAKSEVSTYADSGSLRMYEDIPSIFTFLVCDWDQLSISYYPSKLDQLASLSKFLFSTPFEAPLSHEWSSALNIVYQSIACYATSFEAHVYEKIQENLQNLVTRKFSDSLFSSLRELIVLSHNRKFVECAHTFLFPIFHSLQHSITNGTDLSTLGKLWAHIGMFRLSQLLPSSSIDPSLKYSMKLHWIQSILQQIVSEVDIRQQIENLFTGKTENLILEKLNKQITQLTLKQHETEIKVPVRPPSSQYGEIYAESQRFSTSFADKTRVFALIKDLFDLPFVSKSSQDLEMTSSQEKLWQDKSGHFVTTLMNKYPMYEDVIVPMSVAIFQIKHGLRLLANETMLKNKNYISTLKRLPQECAVMSKNWDVIASAEFFLSEEVATMLKEISPDTFTFYTWYSTVLKIALYKIYIHTFNSHHISHKSLQILNRVFARYESIMNEVETEKSRKEADENAFYKYKTRSHTELTQEQLDEKAFRQMFPDFMRKFKEFDDTPNQMQSQNVAVEEEEEEEEEEVNFNEYSFSQQEMYQLHRIHGSIFRHLSMRFSKNVAEVTEKDRRDRLELSYKLYRHIVTTSMPLTLVNAEMRSSHFLTISQLVKESQTRDPSQKLEIHNIYKDPMIEEVKHIWKPMEEFSLKILEYLAEWPENPLLISLLKIANRIVTFPVTTPLIQIVTGLEVLLKKGYEWEGYASKRVSLQSFLEVFSSIILRWRRLESESWPQLLLSIDRQFEYSATTWWFHMYRILFKNADLITKDTLKDIFTSLEQFMQTSNYGEFMFRLTMLQSFYQQLCLVSHTNENTKILMNMLANYYSYYSQFVPNFQERLEAVKKPVLDKFKDFIKLTRWETSRINYHRVREIADKAHKNLNKITKEYKTVLEESMMSIFARPEEEIETCKVNVATDNVLSDYVFKINDFVLKKTKGPATPEIPQNFKSLLQLDDNSLPHNRLVSIHKVMTKLCKNDILSTSSLRQDIQSIDEFSVHIIERAQDLKQNEKEKSVKKFAFAELIKTLSSMGISSRIASITQEQKEVFHLFSLSGVQMNQETVHPLIYSLFSKTENYYFKIIGKILHLRNAAQNFSKELSKREVDKTVGYSEQLLLMITKQRELVSDVVKQLAMWKHYGRIVEQVRGEDVVVKQEKAKKWYLNVKDRLDIFSEILQEFLLVSESFPSHVKIQVERVTKEAIAALSQIRLEMSGWLSQFSNLDLVLWTSKQVNEINSIFSKFQEISLPLLSISSLIPDTSLISGIYNFIESMKTLEKSFQFEIQHENKKESDVSQQFISHFNSFITEIQLLIQSAIKLPKPLKSKENKEENKEEENKEENEEEEEETNILAMNQYYSSLLELLNPQILNDKMSTLLSWLHSNISSKETFPLLFQYFSQLLPFINQYELLLQGILLEFSQFHKSICKLSYILFNIFTNLYLKGFCTPVEEEEADPNMKLQDNVSGTGIGEGEGNKDVSDQIEDEEDALGLKDDKPPPPPETEKKPKEDEGKEMENDFEGTMHDMPENEEKDENEDSEEEKEEEEDIQKEMGETNPDKENVLDEDVWRSEDEEEKDQEEEEEEESKLEKDAPMESEKPSEELAAKQNEKEKKDKESDKKDKKDQKGKEEDVEAEDIPDDENEDENQEDQENYDNDENMEENHHIEMNEQEELKIDEDTKIDEDMDEEEEEEDKGENAEDMETADNEEEIKDEKEKEEKKEEELQQDENVSEETLNNQIQEEIEKNEEEKEEEQSKDPVHANENQDENQVEESREQPYGVHDNVGMPSSIQMQEEKDKQENDSRDQTMPKQDQQMNAAGVTQDDQKYEDAVNKAEQDMPQQKERIDPNPYRNYGDALKQWKKRLQVVDIQVEENNMDLDNNEEQQAEGKDEDDDKSLYRYLEQETNKEEKQALGPTKDEQNVQQKNEEEEAEQEQKEQDKMQESKEEKLPEEKKKELEKNSMSSLDQKPMKAKAKEEQEDIEMQDVQDTKDDVILMDEEEHGKINTISTTETQEEEESQPKSAQDILEMRNKVEALVNQWRDRGQKQNGEELWKKYEYLTNDLAQELCEQLRLILEPTLATKLKGDYKTGKRINMKKVIPYIASDFKKDKIWLRRTQPSKRDYQIMLAIDDSESMRDNHAGQIACEALAMIAKAMQQLEVGQLSIVSFGETIKLLHPFDVPFSPQSGADVIVDFTFKQKVTNVEALLDNLVKILDVAKTNASQADCMQIVFLISDGRFSEREGTKKWLREAHEKNIFVVFIVVDNPKSRDSILELKDVSYPNGKLLITRYIDKFPFNYYVILRDINKLPDVLADALRQWFELIKSM